MFAELCDEVDAEFKCFLFYSKIRWLSKGKVFQRVVSLRNELHTFFFFGEQAPSPRFADKILIAKLVLFSDFLNLFKCIKHINDKVVTKF